MKTTTKTTSFIGGIMGLIVFAFVGLLPALVYGGYAGVGLASALFGLPIHEHILAQAMVFLGMLVCSLATGGLFVLGGAVVGSGVGAMVESVEHKAVEARGTK